VLIHRAGYSDRGRALETAFVAAGLGKVPGTSASDMVAYRIRQQTVSRTKSPSLVQFDLGLKLNRGMTARRQGQP
jgi:hypothetical protein